MMNKKTKCRRQKRNKPRKTRKYRRNYKKKIGAGPEDENISTTTSAEAHSTTSAATTSDITPQEETKQPETTTGILGLGTFGLENITNVGNFFTGYKDEKDLKKQAYINRLCKGVPAFKYNKKYYTEDNKYDINKCLTDLNQYTIKEINEQRKDKICKDLFKRKYVSQNDARLRAKYGSVDKCVTRFDEFRWS